MNVTDVTPKRGLRFRHAKTTAVRRVDGVEQTTDVCLITAVRWTKDRSDAMVFWRFDFGEPGIGQGRWKASTTPDPRFPELRPGFFGSVAEWVD